MAEKEQELVKIKKEREEYENQVKKLKDKLKGTGEGMDGAATDMTDLKEALGELEKKGELILSKQKNLEKKEKMEPWNVDTISSDGFSKTIINKPVGKGDDELSEEEKEKRMKEFVKKNEVDIKKYGMFRNFDDSRRFLMEHTNLACDDTANYLVVWCINLEMEEKSELMAHVAHQTICMQFILELAKQLERDPRSCISAFFHRIQQAEVEYKRAFTEELEAFKDRVRKRAEQKVEALMKEAEEEERQQRLGPGGLDPLEVLETLPEELKACFESQDVGLLQKTISKMNPEDAALHMKRCVESGLWVPEAKNAK